MRKLILLMILLVCSGCMTTSSRNPLYEPAKRVNETIMPEYRKYVQQDKTLTEDQKRFRKANADAFGMLLREYGE